MAALERALVFVGFMGAGKTTAALAVADALGVPALDSDRLLAERFGRSIAEEVERGGEEAFRAAEEQLVCELLDQAGRAGHRAVLALGGGSVLSARVRAALEPHVTVLLEVDMEEAWERAGGGQRPLAQDRDAFAAVYARRLPVYEELADAFLPPDRRGLADAVAAGTRAGSGATSVAVRALPALRTLAAAPAGTRLLWASAASGEYPVMVGRGLLAERDGERLAALWPLDRSRSRPFCVSDEIVRDLYAGRLGELAGTIAITPGEEHKTLASAERVWSALAGAGMTRADHVVALGGGVVGDLAGFCAATYQRGVPVVHVPTTLVAQVDSAYGGKTGVDLPQAKNYVGAYHQPAGVLADPDTLATLPAAELAAGWVEVLKTALIAGGRLWERVADGAAVDEHVILACARTKLAVVAADERDGGARQVLNLGHTLGHAIETVTGYTRYRHGEAVGLGLLAALSLSGQAQLRERVRALMLDRGLPVTIDDDEEDVSVDVLLEAVARDKKRVAADVPFVLVRAPGDVQFGCEVSSEEIRAAVAELRR
jgi:shikimate kinase/3-dehydroquinate synthase